VSRYRYGKKESKPCCVAGFVYTAPAVKTVTTSRTEELVRAANTLLAQAKTELREVNNARYRADLALARAEETLRRI
jgi:hypothetical protein